MSGPHKLWNLLVEAPKGLVAGRRSVPAFGLPFEVLWIPSRGSREGVPGGDRPNFAKSRGLRIREEEALWAGREAILTPNLYPFATRHGLLWPREGHPREWPMPFLQEAFALLEENGGTLLGNSVGASASIPLCHLHLFPEKSPVWPRVEWEELGVVQVGGEVLHAATPSRAFPLLLVRISGGNSHSRAALCRALLDRRMTPAVNLGATCSEVYLFPRRVEVPEPYYDHALGGMELFGRFVYPEEHGFLGAGKGDLECALKGALVPMREEERRALRTVLREIGERKL